MNAESIFRNIWKNNDLLHAKIPVSRITTGISAHDETPHGVILETQNFLKYPSNAGIRQKISLLKIVFHARGRAELDTLAEAMDATLFGVTHAIRWDSADANIHFRRTRRSFSCSRHDLWIMEMEVELTADFT